MTEADDLIAAHRTVDGTPKPVDTRGERIFYGVLCIGLGIFLHVVWPLFSTAVAQRVCGGS